MPNDFYNASGSPTDGSEVTSPIMRTEFSAIAAGFNKLPTLAGNAYKIVYVNAAGTALDVLANAQAITTFLANPSSANLAAAVSDETGTGALVFANSPTLFTPALGTPSGGVLTNCNGLPIGGVTGLGAGVATFLATPSSANLEAAVTGETGSGALVFATSPTLVTPALGTPASGTLTNCTGLLSTGMLFTSAETGAASRTARAKLQEIVNVLDFGAVGDGATDDSTSIASAIATGKDVFIPGGLTFLTTAQTISTAKQRVYGAGCLKLKNTTNQSVLIVAAADVRIEGIEIDGNRANQTVIATAPTAAETALGSGISISDGYDRIRITGCYIHDSRLAGVGFQGNSDDCWIDDNRIEDTGHTGVYFCDSAKPCLNPHIGGNRIKGMGKQAASSDGIGTVGIQHGTITGNRVKADETTGNGISGIALEAACHYTTITGNTILGVSIVGTTAMSGIQVNDSHHVTVSANTIKKCNIGVDVHGAVANTYDISIVGNILDDCGYFGHAISIAPADIASEYRIVIIGNTISASPYGAILVWGASHTVIAGNQINGVNLQATASKRFLSGIAVGSQSYYNTITGNMINEGSGGNMLAGVQELCPSAGNISTANTIRDNRITGADYDVLCSTAATGTSVVSRVTRLMDTNVTAAPSTGHWEVGQRIEQDNPSSAGYNGWVCTVAGTFGAQTATNASITSGTTTLTFADAADAANAAANAANAAARKKMNKKLMEYALKMLGV